MLDPEADADAFARSVGLGLLSVLTGSGASSVASPPAPPADDQHGYPGADHEQNGHPDQRVLQVSRMNLMIVDSLCSCGCADGGWGPRPLALAAELRPCGAMVNVVSP